MKKEYVFTAAILLVLWQIAAMNVGNDILIPYPMDVLRSLSALVTEPKTWNSVVMTVARTAKGFFISMIFALILSICSDSSSVFRKLFAPIQILARTIPNISYIVLALIWLGSEGAVTAVTFMILFPIFFNGFMNALDAEPAVLKDAERMYPESFARRTKIRLLPVLAHEFLRTGKTAASMGLKVGVMAEIIGQVRSGIGRQMHYCRISLDTSGILAWTLIIILISILFDLVFNCMIGVIEKEEQGYGKT